jgi:hypothetical protein
MTQIEPRVGPLTHSWYAFLGYDRPRRLAGIGADDRRDRRWPRGTQGACSHDGLVTMPTFCRHRCFLPEDAVEMAGI